MQWKMRYAAHLGIMDADAPLFLESAGSADPMDQIAFIAAQGFAGIEDNLLKSRTPAVQAGIGQALVRHGLEMGCFVGNLDGARRAMWGIDSNDARDVLRTDLAETIEAAKRSGGRNVTTVGQRDPSVPLACQLIAMTENLKRLADMAEAGGVVLSIEPTSERKFPDMIPSHVLDAHAIVRAVDHPAVRMVFDIGHIQEMDGDLIPNLDRCWDTISVIQVADNPGRLELGSGELNWPNILRHIRSRGYTGLIELENHNSQPGLAGEKIVLDALERIDLAI